MYYLRNSNRHVLFRALGLLCSALLTGCALPVEQRSVQICADCTAHWLEGPLLAYSRNLTPAAPVVHIYFEGDGQPFLRPGIAAANPNSSQLLALQLMQQDPAPSIYLNRPCYGVNTPPLTCTPANWTTQRYSTATIQQLQRALHTIIEQQQLTAAQLVFIGHSGGGAIAVLMAQKTQNVAAIITLAGNLDTDAWAQLHGYTPLVNSLNPAQQPQLPANILRWHFAGADDANIPANLIKSAAQSDTQAVFKALPNTHHNTGWQTHWPAILADLRRTLSEK